MRVDQPLPGDLVIRPRADGVSLIPHSVFVITRWPDSERVIAGPYQSAWYALTQATRLLTDRAGYIWRDHARHHDGSESHRGCPPRQAAGAHWGTALIAAWTAGRSSIGRASAGSRTVNR